MHSCTGTIFDQPPEEMRVAEKQGVCSCGTYGYDYPNLDVDRKSVAALLVLTQVSTQHQAIGNIQWTIDSLCLIVIDATNRFT